MKYITPLLCLLLIQTQFYAHAETEEEEMARMQRQLNNNIFGIEKEPAPAAPEPAAAEPAPAAPAVAETSEDDSKIPLSKFTSYKLAGVSLGKDEQAVLDSLQNQGYNCNAPQLAQVRQLTGKKMCMYISGEDPKVAMIGFSGGVLHDLETHETYTTGFPEKFFKKAKNKFMKKYGSDASCKAKGKGEICEVFGHGYRVLFRTETQGSDKAKIIHRIARM